MDYVDHLRQRLRDVSLADLHRAKHKKAAFLEFQFGYVCQVTIGRLDTEIQHELDRRCNFVTVTSPI